MLIVRWHICSGLVAFPFPAFHSASHPNIFMFSKTYFGNFSVYVKYLLTHNKRKLE